MATLHVLEGETIFAPGAEAYATVFNVCGRQVYVWNEAPDEQFQITECGWSCEVVLWCRWRHKGRLLARSLTEVALLDAVKFEVFVLVGTANTEYDAQPIRAYARLAVIWLAKESSDIVSEMTQAKLDDIAKDAYRGV